MVDPQDEMVEVVAADGQVERLVTRSEMRAGNLRHRGVYVLVLRPSRNLVVHQRADWKDVWPGFWDIAFGGVVGVGEGWLDAAERELAEEAGITGVELAPIGGLMSFCDEDTSVVGKGYLASTSQELSCPDGEVQQVDEVPVDELEGWLRCRQVCPDSLSALLPLIRTYPQ